ncbi:unnamed protein product [Calypogeia fissa]
MSKVKMWVVIVAILVLLAESAHHVQARPGPLAFFEAETLSFPSLLSRQLLSEEPVVMKPENVNLSKSDAEELDSEEELDAVCIENGSCEEKRLLMETIDYKTDGPNNPTDPPH